jgi:hypothetical protein
MNHRYKNRTNRSLATAKAIIASKPVKLKIEGLIFLFMITAAITSLYRWAGMNLITWEDVYRISLAVHPNRIRVITNGAAAVPKPTKEMIIPAVFFCFAIMSKPNTKIKNPMTIIPSAIGFIISFPP